MDKYTVDIISPLVAQLGETVAEMILREAVLNARGHEGALLELEGQAVELDCRPPLCGELVCAGTMTWAVAGRQFSAADVATMRGRKITLREMWR